MITINLARRNFRLIRVVGVSLWTSVAVLSVIIGGLLIDSAQREGASRRMEEESAKLRQDWQQLGDTTQVDGGISTEQEKTIKRLSHLNSLGLPASMNPLTLLQLMEETVPGDVRLVRMEQKRDLATVELVAESKSLSSLTQFLFVLEEKLSSTALVLLREQSERESSAGQWKRFTIRLEESRPDAS